MTGGTLSASGGQINLASVASVASPGEVSAVDFMPTVGLTMGSISLSQGALLDVSADAAGTVRIRGGQFVITDATLSSDTGNTNGSPIAIDINITSDLSISAAAVPARPLQSAVPITVHAKNTLMTDPRVTFWIGPALALPYWQ